MEQRIDDTLQEAVDEENDKIIRNYNDVFEYYCEDYQEHSEADHIKDLNN